MSRISPIDWLLHPHNVKNIVSTLLFFRASDCGPQRLLATLVVVNARAAAAAGNGGGDCDGGMTTQGM